MLLFVHIAKADRGSSPVRSQQRPPGADGGGVRKGGDHSWRKRRCFLSIIPRRERNGSRSRLSDIIDILVKGRQ